MLSPFGFGGYRVSPETRAHLGALKKAIRLGCNVLDTSSVYTDGSSEVLFGQIVAELVQKADVVREELVVITKSGYLSEGTESTRQSPPAYSQEDVTPVSQGSAYSLSPVVLEDQISESLARLGMETVDVLMLHNPETLLDARPDLRDSFYDMIASAFTHLEKEVKRGRIQYYGVSSNTFGKPDAPNYVSLDRIVQAANDVKAENSFAAVQYPFNILEPEALTSHVSDKAAEHGLMRFSNRPLNALYKDKDLMRLLKEAFDFCIHLEKNYPGLSDESLPLAQNFAWGQILAHNQAQINTIDRWVNALDSKILPAYEKSLAKLDEYRQLRHWGDKYRVATARLFERLTWLNEARASKNSLPTEQAVDAIWPELSSVASMTTLSQKALLAALSAQVSDCVLVGMRRGAYVREVMFNVGPAPDVESAREPAHYSRFMEELEKKKQ